MPNPIVLIHGYSDKAESFRAWRDALKGKDPAYDVDLVYACNYKTLTNEVSIEDIAEGFDRALHHAGVKGDFDAIVHSTGMLVIRAWLVTYPTRVQHLKHLIGIAPATFGSPLAHKGRSWIGSIFKGSKERGPDFMEAGDKVLEGLELGSSFTWDLAHRDLLTDKPVFGKDGTTPYAFIFCGAEDYGGLRSLINSEGTDGTVRWAGCPLNTLKVVVDLTRDRADPDTGRRKRAYFEKATAEMTPLIFVKDKDHGSILTRPGEDLVNMVYDALQVSTLDAFNDWKAAAQAKSDALRRDKGIPDYQQFVIHAQDERGRPIDDWNLALFPHGPDEDGEPVKMDVHSFKGDQSYRCFHVNLTEAAEKTGNNRMWLRLIASSGTALVGYSGVADYQPDPDEDPDNDRPSSWVAWLDLTNITDELGYELFFPFTTTLIELRLNREPLPLQGVNRVLKFV